MAIKEFFTNERGITPATLEAFGVEFREDDVAALPYTEGYKMRRHDPDGTRHFFAEGDISGLFFCDTIPGDVAFIVEGETDTMRLWQELRAEGSTALVFGISGVNGWKEEYADILGDVETVYVVLDNDSDYKVQSAVDVAYRNIRKSLGSRAIRLHLPTSPEPVNDLCEFFDTYTLDTLRLLVETAPQAGGYFQSLDLTKPAPPVDWMVNDLLGQGDVCMLLGEPNIGKSWLSMALAVAVADAGENWLGHSVLNHGRVLYVDEENPEDVVRTRLSQLGLDMATATNVRYIHQQGIRLDSHPERLIDEAIDFQPTLIVLDSLTRLHTGDENNAQVIASLFNDAILPLSRETGATTLVLHHVNKSDSTSGFGRARGSSDITASIDTGLDVRRGGSNRLNVVHFRSRRRSAGDVFSAEILDAPDGSVSVVTRGNPVF